VFRSYPFSKNQILETGKNRRDPNPAAAAAGGK
jgi:hypothetical protein